MQIQETITPAETLIGALRVHTRELHDQAERAMQIMSPEMNIHSYIDKLARLHAFFKELDLQLRCRVTEENRQTVASQLSRLKNDLNALGDSSVPKMNFAAEADFFSSLNDSYFRIGVFYVLEGSALGGQIVARHVRQKFNLEGEIGTTYFFGDGHRTHELWRQKILEISKYDAIPEVWPRVIEGAEKTFALFAKLF